MKRGSDSWRLVAQFDWYVVFPAFSAGRGACIAGACASPLRRVGPLAGENDGGTVRTRVTAALVAALAFLACLATPALAVAPARLTSKITDHASAFRHRRAAASAAGPGIDQRHRVNPAEMHESGTSAAPQLSRSNETAVIVGAVVLLLALVILVTRRMSRRSRPRARPVRGPPPGPPAEELAAIAARALVDTDDAVRTSEQELGFATARFGEHAAVPFSAALQAARAELGAAFRLRQLLDDDVAAGEATTRSYLAEIDTRCAEASRLLDEQSEAFDRLQDLEAGTPEMLAEVDAHVVQQTVRVSKSRQILDHLAAKYTPLAVAAVAANPAEAAERLDFAGSSLATARRQPAFRQSGEAAVLLQAAESGADQATDLLNGVEHMEAELTQAASALPAALREVDAEIAEASELLSRQPGGERADLVARARAVAAAVRTQQSAGPFDALAALRDVQQADSALDQALASVREERDRQERARAVLDQAMLVARSSVTAAEDFITTRRGAVGATARTRLTEAQRHFQQAIGHALPDPETALTEAQHADSLAQQARALAEQDVASFGACHGGPAAGDGGVVAGLSGAILGGILIDSAPHGGGARGDGVGPGSFGGVGTRGRHSAAGSERPTGQWPPP